MLIARDLGGELESLPDDKLSGGSTTKHYSNHKTDLQNPESAATRQPDNIPTLRTSR
jgi:hypothetical protein